MNEPAVPRLTDEALDEFIEIFKEEFGETISRTEAEVETLPRKPGGTTASYATADVIPAALSHAGSTAPPAGSRTEALRWIG